MQYEVRHTFDKLLRYSYHIILIYNIPGGYEKSRNPNLDPSQIILICMMMPCFRANLPHRSDSAVVDRLDA